MRIGLDATTRLHGGGALHLKQILEQWLRLGVYQRHDVVVFARPENLEVIRQWTGGLASLVPQAVVSLGTFWRMAWQQLVLPVLAWKSGLDVLFCPGNTCPLVCKTPTVVMLQNAAPFSPLITPRSEGVSGWLSFRVLKKMMVLSAKHAERVIFISQYFRSLFVSTGVVSPDRAEVIYLGRELTTSEGSDVEIVAKLRQLRPLIICISHLYRYKRLSVLIAAYQLQRECLVTLGFRLRIVGKVVDKSEYRRLRQMITDYHLEDWVELTGDVPQSQISRILSLASFFVFQSSCENCPSTLIEALASGVPVTCSDVGVMPEIAGDAALYYNPLDVADLGRALVQMATNERLRGELVAHAASQVLLFPSWQRVAMSTLACLESASAKKDQTSCSVREHFDRQAPEWAIRYGPKGSMAYRARLLVDALGGQLSKTKNVLDFGCGSGSISWALANAGHSVQGLDLSAEMVQRARQSYVMDKLEFRLREDVNSRLPYRDSCFDAIVASSVFEYVTDVDSCIRELRRVCRAGGVLIATVPNPLHPVRWMERMERVLRRVWRAGRLAPPSRRQEYLALSINRWSVNTWTDLLARSGWTVVSVKNRTTPLMLIEAVNSEDTEPDRQR